MICYPQSHIEFECVVFQRVDVVSTLALPVHCSVQLVQLCLSSRRENS